MNPDTREFEPLPKELSPGDVRQAWPQFTIGQTVELGGVVFVVRKITKKDLVIRPKAVR